MPAMTNIKQLKDETISFLLRISDTEEYKNLNPKLIVQGDTEALDELTDRVNNFLVEKIISIFPKEDQEILKYRGDLPFDKGFYPTLQNKSRVKQAQVRELLRYSMKMSQRELPIWYEEVGYLYFEKYSGAEKLLNILEAK